ncbi:MAG: FKBP-type peptidyl-prolyl cis-trans isomerase [Alphaproteobacteria bacterium]|nr:FKBP-type peptidyl-prolyl cis-trans isomerase [Alphaproteobacteria bacterium]
MMPFPKWISWIFVCLLAYIIYVGNQSQKPPESAPKEAPVTSQATQPKDYESLRKLVDGDRWYRAINPSYIGDADIKEVSVGEGAGVQCGDDVSVLLRGTREDGANFDASHDESKPLEFMVGKAPFAALNEGLIGMKLDGQRVLDAPASQVYSDPEKRNFSEIKFHLTLKKHVSMSPDSLSATAVTLVAGNDKKEPARCGATLRAAVTIFNAKGERIAHTSEPVSITLGARELAWGVDVLVRGMRIDEQRLLTLPPAYLKQATKADAALTKLRRALDSNEVRFVQIERRP